MSELATMIHRAIGTRSVERAARDWQVNPWLLRNILKGRTRRPKPVDLERIAQGSGIPYEVLAVAAYKNGSRQDGQKDGDG